MCGSVAGYRLVTQTPSTLPANGQTSLSAAIARQRSTAEPFAWDTTVNDNSDTDASGAPFAICAGR